MARKKRKRIIKHTSSIKTTRHFLNKLVKKTTLARYIKKMGFHTDPKKEKRV